MIDIELSPELFRYQQAIKDWSVQAVRPYARQADRDKRIPANTKEILDTCPVPLDRIDEGDWKLPTFPDGESLRFLAYSEAVAYGDCWLFESMSRGIAHLLVAQMGTPEQIERWSTPYAKPGSGSTGIAFTEPGVGSDTSRLSTTARRDGDRWVLNGSKIYCTRGADADYILVMATVDKSMGRAGIRAFAVEQENPGLIITKANEDKLGLRSWMTSAFTLENCEIPLDRQMGWSGGEESPTAAKSLGKALSAFNITRPMVALQSVGVAQAALDVATPILHSRRTGFAPHRWTQIQAQLEQMGAFLQRVRRLAYRTGWLETNGLPSRHDANLAKTFGPATSELVVRRCMQLLGPDGASEELLIEKWYRDSKIFDIYEGTGQLMRSMISQELMGAAAGR